ncbi:MAG: hypothetical protein WCT05_10200 [Lentisphaeria bacterium]
MEKQDTKLQQKTEKSGNPSDGMFPDGSTMALYAAEPLDPETGVMSSTEKRILSSIMSPEPPLPYPIRSLPMRFGPAAQEYVIAEADREFLLKKLYPFFPCPGLHEVRFDLHEEKYFKVGEFKVIRENSRNFLVSPYYAHSGGMVIDWMDEQNAESQILLTAK